jgi:hypothetical protein
MGEIDTARFFAWPVALQQQARQFCPANTAGHDPFNAPAREYATDRCFEFLAIR